MGAVENVRSDENHDVLRLLRHGRLAWLLALVHLSPHIATTVSLCFSR